MKQSHRSSASDWLVNVSGQQVGDYDLDEYIGCGKIGYVYRAHRRDIPEIERAVKLVPDSKTAGRRS